MKLYLSIMYMILSISSRRLCAQTSTMRLSSSLPDAPLMMCRVTVVVLPDELELPEFELDALLFVPAAAAAAFAAFFGEMIGSACDRGAAAPVADDDDCPGCCFDGDDRALRFASAPGGGLPEFVRFDIVRREKRVLLGAFDLQQSCQCDPTRRAGSCSTLLTEGQETFHLVQTRAEEATGELHFIQALPGIVIHAITENKDVKLFTLAMNRAESKLIARHSRDCNKSKREIHTLSFNSE